ncbi:hypothetical protein BGZ82_005536 [Podila clonocystis]|nr:hypothetical protein BGZ82_005536 [Podila clonocystis]
MSGRARSALPGFTTPAGGPLDETAHERQRHLRQNQEIIRLCSLKSIQARQLQEKINQVERDNLELRLALSRKDQAARISKNQSPGQSYYRPNLYSEVRTDRFKYPGHSYRSPLSGKDSASQDLLHQRFSALNTSYQHSLQEPRKRLTKSGRYFSAGKGPPGLISSTLDRVLGAVEAHKSYPNIDQLPTIAENGLQDLTSSHVRMVAEKKTETGLSKSKVQEISQPLAGTDVPQVLVPSDDNPEDLAFRSAKPRGTISKDKSTKAETTGSSPAAGRGKKVAMKRSSKDTDRMASSGKTRTMHILDSPKQTSAHHRLLGRESLKQLSPGELLKKMNKKLLGRSQTPVLKNTQLSCTLAPTGSSSVWMPKSTRLGTCSSIATTLASRTTVALPAPDLQPSSFVDASAGLIKDKEFPAKTVPLGDPKSGLVHKRRRPDAQPRQEIPLPSHSQESGTPEKDAPEARYELRKRKK